MRCAKRTSPGVATLKWYALALQRYTIQVFPSSADALLHPGLAGDHNSSRLQLEWVICALET
jgi:hypothetical protein